MMGLGVGIFLIAAGAILAFGINVDTGGTINLHTIGLILLVVGVLGTLLSMVFWSSWAGPGRYIRRRSTYVDGGAPTRRDVIEEDPL
jgi:hypothetical protein